MHAAIHHAFAVYVAHGGGHHRDAFTGGYQADVGKHPLHLKGDLRLEAGVLAGLDQVGVHARCAGAADEDEAFVLEINHADFGFGPFEQRVPHGQSKEHFLVEQAVEGQALGALTGTRRIPMSMRFSVVSSVTSRALPSLIESSTPG